MFILQGAPYFLAMNTETIKRQLKIKKFRRPMFNLAYFHAVNKHQTIKRQLKIIKKKNRRLTFNLAYFHIVKSNNQKAKKH